MTRMRVLDIVRAVYNMQRTLAFLLALLTVAGLTSFAGANHPSNCTDATGGSVVIPIAGAAGGSTAAFIPNCVIVSSGSDITWNNEDAASVCVNGACFAPHDPENTNGHGNCFRYSAAAPRGTGDSNGMQVTDTWTIWVKYDGAKFFVSTAGASGPWTDCTTAVDALNSDGNHAVVNYQCHVHHGMTARFVVLK